jgi:hypothetical protein
VSYPIRTVGALATFLCVASVHAAVTMTLEWQTSLDGQSWQSGTRDVAPSQSQVEYRLLVHWTPVGTASAFNVVQLDAVVEGVAGAGPADALVGNAGFVLNNNFNTGELVQRTARRWNNFIVLDSFLDPFAPGSMDINGGARFLAPGQGTATFGGGLLFGSPIVVLRATLALDGSLGRRDIYGVAPQPVIGAPPFFAYVHAWNGDVYSRVPVDSVTQLPAAIIVPTPASVSTVLIGAMVAASRRRRQHHLA